MFGCLGRLGCLALLAILAVAGWFTRAWWMPRVGLEPPGVEASASGVEADAAFRPIRESAAERGRAAVASLGPRRGYVTLTGDEAVAYLVSRFVERIPPAAEQVEAAVVGDRLELRARVPLEDLSTIEGLGPLRQLLGARETVHVSGTVEVVRPGLAQFRVERMRVRNLSVPSGAVPILLREIWRGERPDGLAPNAIGIEIPEDVGEIRVRGGQVIFYRTV